MVQEGLIGTSVGRYVIESVIGRGGMGVVYLARDEAGQPVALKLMAPEVTSNAEFRERFLREAALTLEHPNVVPVYDAGDADGELYIAMRYVEGADLKKLILSEKRLEPARAVALVEQAAAALDFAHENRIVHRDVKPQNILIDSEDGSERAYLTDFGLIKRISPDSSFTTGPYLMGTVYYMAPEQIEGKAVDGRADVYSLGCIAYECLTGSVPYDFETEAAVLWAHMNSTPRPVTDSLPLLPSEIDSVVAKAMARSPDDRYLTAGELALSLGTSLGVSVARPRSLWGSRMSMSGRHRRLALRSRAPVSVAEAQSFSSAKGFLIGAAAVLLALGVALGVRSDGGQRPVSDQAVSSPSNETVADLPETGRTQSSPEAERKRSSIPADGDLNGLLPGSSTTDSLLFPPSRAPSSAIGSASGSEQPSGSGRPRAPNIPTGALEQQGCTGLVPFFWVPAHRVEPYVDDRFTLRTELQDDDNGNLRRMAQVNVTTFSCEVNLEGRSLGRTERALVTTLIETPAASGPADALFDAYVLRWYESNRDVRRWYQAAPTFRKPSLEWVRTMVQRFRSPNSQGERDIWFTAPPPATAPFSLRGVVRGPNAALPTFIARWWAPHRRGALAIRDEVHSAGFPPARLTLTIDDLRPDSLLERLLGPQRTWTYNDPFGWHVSSVAVTTKKVFACGEKC